MPKCKTDQKTKDPAGGTLVPGNSKGASLLEYGITIGLIGIVSLSAVLALGEEVSELFGTSSAKIASANTLQLASGGTPPPPPPPSTDPNAFILEFETASVTLHPSAGGIITIDWGHPDANAGCPTNASAPATLTCSAYPGVGTYQVAITGDLWGYGNPFSTTQDDYTRLVQWGNTNLQTIEWAFADTLNMTSVPANLPPSITQLNGVFSGSNINDPNIAAWDVSFVRNMSDMFTQNTSFNQDISGWNTGNVLSMRAMFTGANAFNQNIGGWDVSNVQNATEMQWMFLSAAAFDQDLTGWCVTNIPSEPNNFADGSAMNPANLPVWGTCPP